MMNAKIIITIFPPAKLVVVIRKEVKIRLVTLTVEIAIVCQMFLVKNVTNVNVITFRIRFQIAKVISESLQENFETSSLFDCLECKCYAIGTKENTTCSDTGKCTCKMGYAGDKCDTCDKGYFKQSDGVCKGNNTYLSTLRGILFSLSFSRM